MRLVWSTLCVLEQPGPQGKALSNPPPQKKSLQISDFFFFFTHLQHFSRVLANIPFSFSIFLALPISVLSSPPPSSLIDSGIRSKGEYAFWREQVGGFLFCFVGSRQKLRYRSLLYIPSQLSVPASASQVLRLQTCSTVPGFFPCLF